MIPLYEASLTFKEVFTLPTKEDCSLAGLPNSLSAAQENLKVPVSPWDISGGP